MSRTPTPKNPGKGFLPIRAVDGGPAPIEPYGRWKERARRIIGMTRPANLHHGMKPFLMNAETWLEAAIAEIELRAGSIGPIAMASLATAAWQLAYSRYWMSEAAKSATPDTKLVETASRLADASTRNKNQALALAVSLARSSTGQNRDPLTAFLDTKSLPEHTVSQVELEVRAVAENEGEGSDE